MASEVKYAPKAVIEELNVLDDTLVPTPRVLLNEVVDDCTIPKTTAWYDEHRGNFDDLVVIQAAIVNHVFGNERLQPERETRYYVQNAEHGNTYIEMNGDAPAEWDFNAHGNPNWQNGMTKEQADGYAALFGGEPKEIK